MSSFEEWKEKMKAVTECLSKKEVVSTVGVIAFMGGSFWLLWNLYQRRSPVTKLMSQISINVQKCWEKAEENLQRTIQSHQIPMIFTLAEKLKLKQKNNEESIRNPFLPPFAQGLFIQDLGSSHRLLFNKFYIIKHHLLITSKQFEPQYSPLTKDDFKQTIFVFKALKGLYYYNSGQKAGASQKHKHIQVLPYEARDLPIFQNILQFSQQKRNQIDFKSSSFEDLMILQYPPFKFKHGLIIIDTSGIVSESESDRGKNEDIKKNRLSMLKERSFKAYQKLYDKLLETKDGQITQYNLIGCEEFLLMVPRKKEKAFDELSINAVGFMGSVLFKNKDQMKRYINQERHGYRMLEDITFPKAKR